MAAAHPGVKRKTLATDAECQAGYVGIVECNES